MTADVELLPCPFCGSAEPIVAEHPEMLPPSFRVICSGGVCHAVVEGRTLVRAKLVWNRRANVAHATAAKDAEIEGLRAEVDQAQASARVWRRLAETCDARAERLAEALREIAGLCETEGDRLGNARSIARAALHPTAAQEGK